MCRVKRRCDDLTGVNGPSTQLGPEGSHESLPNSGAGVIEKEEERAMDTVHQRARRLRYHDDSGWRPLALHSEAGGSSILDIPPRYDAAV
jgi:hypothetical protein